MWWAYWLGFSVQAPLAIAGGSPLKWVVVEDVDMDGGVEELDEELSGWWEEVCKEGCAG